MRMMIKGKISEMSAAEVVAAKAAANEIMAYFLVRECEFYSRVGIDMSRAYQRVLDSGEIPHYSKGNIDMEVETSFGKIETIGNAYRTDFDLTKHAKVSGKDMSVHVEGRKIVPHVFEVSMGVDRLFFAILEHCFREKSGEKDWEWFAFPPEIAPYHVAVFPLIKKDGLDERAREIADSLRRSGIDVDYRESGSIGRRYARADEIGIPYAITIDYETKEKETVTLRYRNDGKQERIKINELESKVKENIKKGRVVL